MSYQVVYTKKAIKSLKKVDKAQQRLIIAWIEKHLINAKDPRALGKALKEDLKAYWRYRVGDYRILADINDNEIKIIVFNIGHRKDIYE
ncbi:addiction module toxin RelE [Salimicrobium jeotgali]|uniref:Addiction module toxin RelE n=1 Tax=Salimicrobium jeotgali TaxID=1230341 RepID=K2GEP7_9BACI|nr:type II toxin-antitoxin system RelE/ParE family toxin [Salimicrobium jeotgali]AKG04471.1 addiction module toxin RelE [Salimicrobium jeotgali]EKE32677.1 plasmid addiction system poison protein [Salimicrobium jeotgali]MBM7695337.1 mRNA interferase RelE/StbE [Salimicrobium jeotgali]